MNNIEVAKIVILKQLIVIKVDSHYKSHIYPITTATQSQEKNLKVKKVYSMLHIIKLVKINLKKLIANLIF